MTERLHFHALEKAMATHSSTLAWKIPGWRSLVGCSPWGREELDTTERIHFHALEKEMATHSSVLAWRIPGTGEPGVRPLYPLNHPPPPTSNPTPTRLVPPRFLASRNCAASPYPCLIAFTSVPKSGIPQPLDLPISMRLCHIPSMGQNFFTDPHTCHTVHSTLSGALACI